MCAKRARTKSSPSEAAEVEPLEAGAAPGWEPLTAALASLQRCQLPAGPELGQLPRPAMVAAASCHAALGFELVKLMQKLCDLDYHIAHVAPQPQRRSSGAGSSTDASEPPPPRIGAADLLPSCALGDELAPLRLPLYEHVMTVQRRAARKLAEATQASGGGLVESCSAAAAADGATAVAERDEFRRLYMDLVTRDASEELETLRQSEDLSQASLPILIDALESGALGVFESASENDLAMRSQ